MESEYVIETIDVPIDELEKAMMEYLAKARENGEATIKLAIFSTENGANTDIGEASIENGRNTRSEIFPPLESPIMYLSFSRYMAGPVPFNPGISPPLGGIYSAGLNIAFFATLRQENASCLKNLSPNKRTLNRGIPAPKHIPITSIAYSKINDAVYKRPMMVKANVSDETFEVITYWNSKPGLVRHKLPVNDLCTRRYKKASSVLSQLFRGKMFRTTKLANQDRKFSIEDIFLAIDKFSDICTKSEFAPRNKESIRRFSFNRFIYDEHSEVSWFLKCINDDLQLAVEVSMKSHLKPWYDALKETYLYSRSSNYKYMSDRDTENILDAAKILYNFQRRVIDNLTYAEATIRPLTPLVWCGWLFEALDYKATPSRLADPRSCNYFLYSFLIKKGRLPGTQVEAPLPVSTFSIYERAL